MLYSMLLNVFHLLRFLHCVLYYQSVAALYKNIEWYQCALTSVLLHMLVPLFFFFGIHKPGLIYCANGLDTGRGRGGIFVAK